MPYRAEPALPCRTPPRQALPNLPHRAEPRQAWPYLACPTVPSLAPPHLACHTSPHLAAPCHALEQRDFVVEASDLGLSLARAAGAPFTQSRIDLPVGQTQSPVDVPPMRPGRGDEHDPGSWVIETCPTPVAHKLAILAPHSDIVDALVTWVVPVGTDQATGPRPYRPRENKHPLLRC